MRGRTRRARSGDIDERRAPAPAAARRACALDKDKHARHHHRRPAARDRGIRSLRSELYRRLLALGAQQDVEPFLREALAVVVEVAGAHQGYLELNEDDDAKAPPRWWIAHGFSDDEIAHVRSLMSQGIVAEALATGRTIVTPSALLDPRFRDRGSVRT